MARRPRGGTLILEANSRERGERGRALLEELVGEALVHRMTVHEDLEARIREGRRERATEPSSRATGKGEPTIPPAIAEVLVLDHHAAHYRAWLDIPVPALENVTPREARKNPRLVPKLKKLIEGIEELYQRSLREGQPAYDPSWMWAELELEEPIELVRHRRN